VAEMEKRLDAVTREAEQKMRELHRSYRREIVVRSEAWPDIRRPSP